MPASVETIGERSIPRVHQLMAGGRRREFPVREDGGYRFPWPGNNLPAYASSFIGRSREIAEVVTMLRNHRLVTLTGAGGMGKTRSALEVAAIAACGYRDGVWFVELAAVSDPGVVAETILSAVPGGLCGDRNSRGAPDLVERLRGRNLLLVLDNCEHLTAQCAPLVRRVLRSCPFVSILATSREPLGVEGECLKWLTPLAVPADGDVDSAAVGAVDAVRLFVDRARFARPEFRFDADVALAVAEICRRLDGLPLAIELAAARLSVLSPDEVVERLDDRFRLLRGRVGEARHQTLQAALDWSHDLLSIEETILLRRVSVFSGGWNLRASEHVCTGAGLIPEEILDLTEALATKSLVVVDRSGAVTRYRLLETVRAFATEKLKQAGEWESTCERHAQWCVARAERAEREHRGPRHQAWLMALDEDQDNFRVALMWSRDHDRIDLVLPMVAALTWFWEARGHLREGLEWLNWALARDDGRDPLLRAKALRGAGLLSWLLGDVASGLPLVEESVDLFRRTGNEAEASGCVCSNAFHLCGDPAQALPVLEDNVGRMRTIGDNDRLAHSLINCGLGQFFAGDVVKAKGSFNECLALPAGSVESDTVGSAFLGLGRVALLEGDMEAAETSFREALDLALRVGDRDSRSTALSWLGDIARVQGDYERARSLIVEALELVADGGPALSVARCKQFLARVELSAGCLDSAQKLYRDSLDEAGAKNMPYHQVRSLQGLAEVAAARGDSDEANALFDQALALARANGDTQAAARAMAGLAGCAASVGDLERCLKFRHEALELQEHLGDLPAVVDSLEALAILSAQHGKSELAARLFAVTVTARTTSGLARAPIDEAEFATQMAAVRKAMPDDEFEAAWTQGATMTMVEAISYASKGRGSKLRPIAGWESLSRAERDIVGLVCDGLTNKEIAAHLFVSARTVTTHLTHIFRKIEVESRRELAREASQRGMGGNSGPVAPRFKRDHA